MEEKILSFIRMKGPTIPLDISKAFNMPLLFASAYLSDLKSQGKLLITDLKFDGTPFYYLKGQEHRLVELSKYLKDKDRKTFELLKEKKVLKDSELEPLQRVSLRNLKDFAIQIEINGEIFWRFFMISEKEAKELIQERYFKAEVKPEIEKKIEKKDEKEIDKEERKEEIKIKKSVKKAREILINEDKIREFFNERNIEIETINVIKKNKDYELKILVPSQIGKVKFFCKVKDKKRVNDADISQAYLKAEFEKLPLYFITTGSLSKKALELCKNLKNINIEELKWV